MLRIKKIKDFSYTLDFMFEFLESIKKEDFDFNHFMDIMYSGIEEFKKVYLKDMEEDFKSICYYLDKYYDIVEKVSEGDKD